MSKARLVITAVVLEGRCQAEVARTYGVSRGWVSKLVTRFGAEGEAAFEARSRRPKSSPSALSAEVVGLIISLRVALLAQGLDAGPDTIAWHLEQHHDTKVSASSISRHLGRAGLVTAEPRKRPRSSYIRFQAEQPNECWQSDFTHYRLADGSDVEILTFLDDHSRLALSIGAHRKVTGALVVAQFGETVACYGAPASTLTDNGMVFTSRFAGGRGGRNGFEAELRRLGITQKNSRPNHPTTCGKVERFQQTLKRWLRAQLAQPKTLAQLQVLCDLYRKHYNERRPHRSLAQRSTPALAYAARPKATPSTRDLNTHDRVRKDRVDSAGSITLRHSGRLHHIGIGRIHAGTRVVVLVQDLHVRVVDAATGELLRELVLNPHRDYQPTGAPKGPTRRRTPGG